MTANIQAFFYGNPDQYPPIINGSRLLARAGFEMDIYCRLDAAKWNVTYPEAVKIHRIETDKGGSWRAYFEFVTRALTQSNKSPVAFVGHDMHGLLPARLLGSRRARPVIYHCHDFSEKDRKLAFGSELVRLFERRFARSSTLVVVPDADRGAVIKQELRLHQAPVTVANAPISRAARSPNALGQALASREKNFSRILFRQGRIGPGHAIEATLRSLPGWGNRNWGFVLMGCGDPEYLTILRSLAQTLDVADRFVILPPVGYDSVAEFTPGATAGHALYESVHINNLHIATASNKIMEYMEAGLPLITSDTPSLRAMVNRLGCGLTADERIPESVSLAINTLFGDPEKARSMGVAARRAFEEEFCYERQFAPVIELLRKLASQK
jgi:glycosyltransferase involved in cell wall biosynthesis